MVRLLLPLATFEPSSVNFSQATASQFVKQSLNCIVVGGQLRDLTQRTATTVVTLT
ncbi:hypothetical protein PL9214520365 [Planktothrix tepida PCC 9214]|uniref:Uncharacterized protein n=1 Tax=Planktothrix tepida PCC 9214 TaxID=671072 RepID=A0A1J1LP89_9CYAN|nr:hypothetical protein PL9214520365 [Planktothrix tepida PCC 9214]